MSLEFNFNEALFNLDEFFSNPPANVPAALVHDWVKVHGLVYHKDNVVIVAGQERDQAKGQAETLTKQLATANETIQIAAQQNATLMRERDDVRQQIQSAIAELQLMSESENGQGGVELVLAILRGIPSDVQA
jgi:hypothetical protein